MGADEKETLQASRTGFRRALPAINVACVSRFCKYVVLLLSVILTLKAVFDAYSFYVARRDIDAELRSKKVSLEYLNVLSQRERALALTTLEGRCLERVQLTMFRIFDADPIQRAYRELMAIKNVMVETVKNLGPEVIDVDKAVKFFDGIEFQLSRIDEHLVPLNDAAKSSANYQKLKNEITIQTEKYIAVAGGDKALRQQAEDIISKRNFADSKYWNMSAIKALATRIDQLREERKSNKERFGDVEDVMVRYAVWIAALTGGAASQHPELDDLAYINERADNVTLQSADCNNFKEYYEAVTSRILAADPTLGKGNTWDKLVHVYQQYLLLYFQTPPAAQTLWVTLLLGGLGALTLNMLRMSSVGWWGLQSDPLWGEIIVGPLLGALAAFGIFLLGSAGLLLTADSSGAQPLSGYFIGLLGFLSGLMHDEAFGQVRRIGIKMFGAKPDEEVVNARAEDRSLAETLKSNSASLAAGLVLKYGIGTRVSLESEFSLLVPSDEAIGRLALTTWTMLNDTQSGAFEKWYKHHHAAKRITKADVAGGGTTTAISELSVDDGTSYVLALDEGELKINNVRVLIADVIWNKGVVHILSGDFP